MGIMFDIPVVVIGGGAVGAAVTRKLSQDLGSRVLLLERNRTIRSDNQTGRNSQVLHAGILYDPEFMPQKASHCVRGNAMAYLHCHIHSVQYSRTGKLVVATTEREEEYVLGVARIAEANKVPQVKILTASEIAGMQPSIKARMGLHVPTSGIIDAVELATSLAGDAERNGARIMTGNEVVSIEPTGDGHRGLLLHVRDLHNNEEYDVRARTVVNCAGLYAVGLAKQLDPSLPYTSRADRGEAAAFSQRASGIAVSMNVYPAPCGYYKDGRVADVPFSELLSLVRKGEATLWTGVHYTPTLDINGGLGDPVTICPMKTPDVAFDDFGRDDGTGKPLKPVESYYDKVKSFTNEQEPGHLLPYLRYHQAGNMVVLNGHPDFVFHQDRQYPMLSLLGIGTPGLTSAMSLAEDVGVIVKGMLQ